MILLPYWPRLHFLLVSSHRKHRNHRKFSRRLYLCHADYIYITQKSQKYAEKVTMIFHFLLFTFHFAMVFHFSLCRRRPFCVFLRFLRDINIICVRILVEHVQEVLKQRACHFDTPSSYYSFFSSSGSFISAPMGMLSGLGKALWTMMYCTMYLSPYSSMAIFVR